MSWHVIDMGLEHAVGTCRQTRLPDIAAVLVVRHAIKSAVDMWLGMLSGILLWLVVGFEV